MLGLKNSGGLILCKGHVVRVIVKLSESTISARRLISANLSTPPGWVKFDRLTGLRIPVNKIQQVRQVDLVRCPENANPF